MNEEFDLIPISALNQYDYCPRRCWLMYVAGEFLPNPYTVEGELLHERAHQGVDTKRGELLQLRHRSDLFLPPRAHRLHRCRGGAG